MSTQDPEESPELTPSELRAFKRHVKGLNTLIAQIRQRYPEAQYYLACSMWSDLNILSGPSHDDGYHARARLDRVIESLRLDHADGGDW